MKFLLLSFIITILSDISPLEPVAGAQGLKELNAAYNSNSQDLLEKFILQHKYIAGASSEDDTTAQISALVNAFVNTYCTDTLKAYLRNAPSYAGFEKYIILQPDIEICFVDDKLDPAELFKLNSGRRDGFTNPSSLYPHHDVYGPFLSANYYKFPDLMNCGKHYYTTDTLGKGRYTPLVADTSMVNILNSFLDNQRLENFRKAGFLREIIKLYPSGMIQYITDGSKKVKVPIYYFNYNFFIDRIVFDKSMQRALIQYSFVNMSCEAIYEKVNSQWIQKVSKGVLQL